ncbi:MAG: hypothetical protein KBC35_01790 [Candidatus Pacebacteria bacterium]|jgi:hypothetical protein|nr:hypothetical protein [Candidatus Paceibacterota bacterium]
MKKYTFLFPLFLFTPLITHAADLQTFLKNVMIFINNYVIIFLLGAAFLFFIINVVRFFIIGSTSDEGREKAKALAIYGVGAFVLIIILWGIVNMLVSSFGFGGKAQPSQDYVDCKTKKTC